MWTRTTSLYRSAAYGSAPELHGGLAGALSGGQQQMLAIGRAMMARPVLMLLDDSARTNAVTQR